jgi:hypothetical protein
MQESVFCSSRRASMNRINGIEIKKTPSLLPAQPPSSFPDSDHQHSTVCRSTFWLVFSVFYILSFWTAAPAAEVTDLIINNARGHLLLSLKIHDAFAKKPEKPATNEVSSTIVFSIVLYQINNFWFDKKITHQTATNTLKYDPLIKEYRLMHSWSSGPPLVVTDLDQAEKLLTEITRSGFRPFARIKTPFFSARRGVLRPTGTPWISLFNRLFATDPGAPLDRAPTNPYTRRILCLQKR